MRRMVASFALAVVVVCGLAGTSPAAAPVKPAVKRFYQAFLSATKRVNPNSGRMSPAALARLLAAGKAVASASTDVGLRPASRPRADEVAAVKEITAVSPAS